jgi:hypothetical protein
MAAEISTGIGKEHEATGQAEVKNDEGTAEKVKNSHSYRNTGVPRAA